MKKKEKEILISYYGYKKEIYDLMVKFYESSTEEEKKDIKSKLDCVKKDYRKIQSKAEEINSHYRKSNKIEKYYDEQVKEMDFIKEFMELKLEELDLKLKLEKKETKSDKIKLEKIEDQISSKKDKVDELMELRRIDFILHEYEHNPINFNNHHPENEYYGNDAIRLLKFFCKRVDEKKVISQSLLNYLRDCIKKITNGGLQIERCFNLVGRKEENPYEYPDYLEGIFSDIMDKKMSHTDAFINSQNNGIDKSDKRLSNQLHKYAPLVLQDWLLGKYIKKNKNHRTNVPLKIDDLDDWQIKKLSNSFNINLNPVKADLLQWAFYWLNNIKNS